ncbi:MAG: hypothetical protein GC154_12790 [bacterium]|nr:hypothetical protein [bacterium]
MPAILLLFTLMFAMLLGGPLLLGWMALMFFLLLPLVLLFHSAQMLVVAPVSMWQTFTNPRVRVNHALEHATANVLEEKYGIKWVAGMAFNDGFMLFGRLPGPSVLMEAAQEALSRLRKGETRLALHPRCGTSLLIGQFLFAVAYIVFFLFMRHFTLFDLIAGLMIVMLLSKPLGLLAQKYITTSTKVDALYLHGVRLDPRGRFLFQTGDQPAPSYGVAGSRRFSMPWLIHG